MSKKAMIYYKVRVEVPAANAFCESEVLAESELNAIKLVKETMEEAVCSFMNAAKHGKEKRTVVEKFPAHFWDNAICTATPQEAAKVLRFAWDRTSKTGPVHIA